MRSRKAGGHRDVPSAKSGVEAGPGGSLVGHVADDSRSAMFDYGQRLHACEHAIGEDNFPAYIFAAIVFFAGAIPNIDERGGYVGGATVVGKANRVGLPIAEQEMLRAHFPQSSGVDIPSQIGTHQAVRFLSRRWGTVRCERRRVRTRGLSEA